MAKLKSKIWEPKRILVPDGTYEMECLKNGRNHTTTIDADSYDDAVRIAAQITGCYESDVMLPVTRAEIDAILKED